MKLERNKSFLICPYPKKNEFILSYLARIKQFNLYPNLNSVLYTIFSKKINIIDISKGIFDKKKLSEFTFIKENEIIEYCLDYNIHHITSNILVCPLCIKDQNFISIEWYQKDHICLIHSLPFINKCLNCKKLLTWNTNNFKICSFCKTPLHLNIDKYIIPLETKIDLDNAYYIYKHILNYKNHSPNSIIYSEEYLSNGLKDASHFIKNMNNLFEIQIRKILFKTNASNFNIETIKHELIVFISHVLTLTNKIKSNDLLSINLKEYTNIDNREYVIKQNISQQLMAYYLQKCLTEKMKYLSKENISNILNLDLKILEDININHILKLEINNLFPLNDFINFCHKISKHSHIQDLKENHIYFRELNKENKIHIIKRMISGDMLTFNFNHKNMFNDLKITNDDYEKNISK
ncbi:hypothetical protein [Acinetobacter sp.]|uniref:hypothetical protein n=1 Tax=Acinetobacter sp. TaxID=472 RepID=UPI0028AB0120|nr:hypothetical protein [Acinetobacter sp.]